MTEITKYVLNMLRLGTKILSIIRRYFHAIYVSVNKPFFRSGLDVKIITKHEISPDDEYRMNGAMLVTVEYAF